MILNRLTITEEINFNTPKVVLDEIAATLGITDEFPCKLILKINKFYNRNKINENYHDDIESLKVIARYVNPYHKNWRRSLLLKAFHFLKSFNINELVSHKNINTIIKPDFKIGLQTNENPESLNACVLYNLCKKYGIETNYNTSIEVMGNCVKLYMMDTQGEIKMKIFNHIKYNADKNEIINIYNLTSRDIENKSCETYRTNENKSCENFYENKSCETYRTNENKFSETYNYEDYERCAEQVLRNEETSEQTSEQTSENPKNNLEAIVMGAIYYKIDLSSCKKPLNEYKLLSKFPYFPEDQNLKYRLRQRHIHPDSLENPYINENFNINFPANMYKNRDLIYLCSQEGLNDESYYTALQTNCLTENFIHGRQGNIWNKETTFLENIQDLDYDQIVIYGIVENYRGALDSKGSSNSQNFTAFTYGELTDTFSNYKRFINPQTNEIFSDENIEKLFLLCKKEKRESESEEVYRERLDLAGEIERVKIYICSKNDIIENFVETYENLDEAHKKMVENCLNNLLHVAMYMRNWDGENDYPLKSEDTNFSQDEQILVDHRVTQSIIKFEKSAKEIGMSAKEIGIGAKEMKNILDLLLMQYHKESNSFVTSNDPSEGLTIGERIDIVKEGEAQGINSCIRMSSNKFCATAYYYMILIGFRLPFNITEVSHIV